MYSLDNLMQWPDDILVSPPEYLWRGMSFEEMLDSYKKHIRTKATVDDEGDERMDRNLKLNKKTKNGAIKKDPINKKKSPYESKRPTGGASVVVRNIPYATTEEELKNHFNHLAKIVQVRIHRDENNNSIGSGSVTFSNKKDALVVVDAMQDSRLGGRPISVVLV